MTLGRVPGFRPSLQGRLRLAELAIQQLILLEFFEIRDVAIRDRRCCLVVPLCIPELPSETSFARALAVAADVLARPFRRLDVRTAPLALASSYGPAS